MDSEDSAQIEVIRALCILCMMWVHVSPGLSVPSYVNGGPADLVGDALGWTMGRIGVTTLSFISGYLFWRTGAYRPVGSVLRRLLFAILVPMLVWSAIFILLATGKAAITGQTGSALRHAGDSWLTALNALTGLAGPTANLSLFFIRDLIVSTILLRLMAPGIARFAWLAPLTAILLLALPQTEPVLFRPQIPVFMLMGAFAARQGWTVRGLSHPRLALPVGILLIGLAPALFDYYPDPSDSGAFLYDLQRRAGIGFILLALSRALLDVTSVRRASRIGRHCYLAYLSHVPIIGLAWVAWQHLFGGPTGPAYTAFYVGAPLAAFALAVLGGVLIDRTPYLMQVILRGKAIDRKEMNAAQRSIP